MNLIHAKKACVSALTGLFLFCIVTPAYAVILVGDKYRALTFAVFGAIIVLTLFLTYAAARHVSTAGDFYIAGGGITGFINGMAIAGDYLSAATLLGVSGLVALYGFDGLLYLVGFFVAFIPVLLLVAEPCHNIGKYTFGDILACRNNFRTSKLVAAVSSIIIAIFYLIPQIVGGRV